MFEKWKLNVGIAILGILATACFSDEPDDVRSEMAGVESAIAGTVLDTHRGNPVENFEVKLVKYWNCSAGLAPGDYCEVVGVANTNSNGDFRLEYNYALRGDEHYRLIYNEGREDDYWTNIITVNGDSYHQDYFHEENLKVGGTTYLNINAYIPVTLRFDLTVLNNDSPPLHTNIRYQGDFDIDSQRVVEENTSNTNFDIQTRPNSDIEIVFWHQEEDASGNLETHYAPIVPFTTSEDPLTTLSFTVDCNDF